MARSLGIRRFCRSALVCCILASVSVGWRSQTTSRSGAFASGEACKVLFEVHVEPVGHERQATPVLLNVKREVAEVGYRSLRDLETGDHVPIQFVERGGAIFLVFILPQQDPGENKQYALVMHEQASAGVSLVRDGDRIDVSVRESPLTSFHFARDQKKPYLYPVFGPSGVRLTRGYPMEDIPGETTDHRHHRSIYTAYGDVNGTDCWSEGDRSGWQRTDEIIAAASGVVSGMLCARNSWLSNAGKKVLTEEREYRFYDTPEDARLIDVQVTFTATEGEVKFGDTKEGGIAAVRVNHAIAGNQKGTLRNSRGGVGEQGETGCWGKRAEWCDYSGPIGDVTAGIAIFDHPSNLRHPTYWHARDYGLMTANCFGISFFQKGSGERGDYILPNGESLAFRYRIVLHRGNPETARLADRYADYATPPVARLVKTE
jgi:hypothetical protein